MSPILTICIPTLNRSEFLRQAIESIFDAKLDLSKVELCISNNASDHDYSTIERLLAAAPKALSIRYVVQQTRLPIDEHMLVVKNLATSPYIYLLGDDDFFLKDQLPLLLDLIEREAPDLAIFNGKLVDGFGELIGSHFNLPPQRYSSIAAAFCDLRDKGTFGSILVKAIHLDDAYFKLLIGTAHGYGCYWFSLFDADSHQKTIKVVIPSFPLVALRMAAKNYSHLEVFFRDIPYEIAIYQRYLPQGLAKKLNQEFKLRYEKKISSVLFLAQMKNSGVEVKNIEKLDPGFYHKNKIKILIGDLFARSGAYKLLRFVYKSIVKRK